MIPVCDGHLCPGSVAVATGFISSTHFLSPQRDCHHLLGHVHEVDGPLGHLLVGLGGEASHLVNSLAHSDHVCREREKEKQKEGNVTERTSLQRFPEQSLKVDLSSQ